MKARMADLEDLPQLVILGAEMLNEIGEKGISEDLLGARLTAIIESDGGAVFVVEEGRQIIGALAAINGPANLGSRRLESSEAALFTAGWERGRGVAAMLVAAWEGWAVEAGCHACVWAHGSGLEAYQKACEALARGAGYMPAGMAYRKELVQPAGS